jgi:hypothetical protein
MPLNIDSTETERLIHELSRLTGEPPEQVVEQALRERLERETTRRQASSMREEIARMQARIRALQPRQAGSDEAIIGYDKTGLPV